MKRRSSSFLIHLSSLLTELIAVFFVTSGPNTAYSSKPLVVCKTETQRLNLTQPRYHELNITKPLQRTRHADPLTYCYYADLLTYCYYADPLTYCYYADLLTYCYYADLLTYCYYADPLTYCYTGMDKLVCTPASNSLIACPGGTVSRLYRHIRQAAIPARVVLGTAVF